MGRTTKTNALNSIAAGLEVMVIHQENVFSSSDEEKVIDTEKKKIKFTNTAPLQKCKTRQPKRNIPNLAGSSMKQQNNKEPCYNSFSVDIESKHRKKNNKKKKK